MILHGATLTGSSTGLLGKLTNVDYSGLIVDEIDVTNADSPGKWNQYEAGFKDGGAITADLLYDATTFESLIAAFAAANETWTFELSDGNMLIVNGYIRSLSMSVPLRSATMHPIEIRCSGRPYFPSSSSSSSSSSSA
jgi:predicted secreted protein